MKGRIFNALLLITSLFGFLEWGKNNVFLFQVEAEVFSKVPKDPLSLLHPFILIPLIGQILLIITLIQKNPSKILLYIGTGGIGILMALVFLVGCLNQNFKILCSAIPFLVTAFFTIRYYRRTINPATVNAIKNAKDGKVTRSKNRKDMFDSMDK